MCKGLKTSAGWIGLSGRRAALPALALAALLSACAAPGQPFDERAYAGEIEKWQAGRHAELKSESGWLTLVGLFWLREGKSRIGAAESNDIVLPAGKAPAEVGALRLEGGAVQFEARPGAGVTADGQPVTSLALRSDADGKPTVLRLGTLSFQVIRRGDRLALRVRDSEHPDRLGFKGTEFFPAAAGWRVPARFERYDPPKSIPIVNVLGMEEGQPSPGAILFEVGGTTYRLDALSEQGEEKLFVIFRDQTSGKETYGAGRYLYVDPPDAAGHLVIDFNKAYSPPCAFTNFATCPLPPPQNRLPLRVEAGEKFAPH